MQVMATGVHDRLLNAICYVDHPLGARILQAGLLLQGKRVHVSPKQYGFPFAIPQDPNNSVSADIRQCPALWRVAVSIW